jgi:hypothetical protein
MQISNFQQKRSIFRTYLLLIIGLAAYSWHLHTEELHQTKFYKQLGEKTKRLSRIMDRNIETHVRDTDRRRDLGTTGINRTIHQQVTDIKKSVDLQYDSLYKELDLIEKGKNQEDIWRKNLTVENSNLQNKTVAANKIRSVMKNLEKEVNYIGLMPIVSPKNWDIAAGDVFRGDVYATSYSLHPRNVTMFVNGDSIPIINGVGKFKRTYHTLGTKYLNTEIRITNPLTKIKRSYTKTFQTAVCE